MASSSSATRRAEELDKSSLRGSSKRMGTGRREEYSDQEDVPSEPLVKVLERRMTLKSKGTGLALAGRESCLMRDLRGLKGILNYWLSVFLVFIPLGLWAGRVKGSAVQVFGFNFLAIVPLAHLMGEATETLASHTGSLVGGLLNATFGNAVEVIVTVNAIRAGLIAVVQGSLIGSILSNMLLVLGMAFFVGGLRRKKAVFNLTGASANVTCLALGSIALALPTIFNQIQGTSKESVLQVSRVSSIVLACVYILFLIFQLGTHAEEFASEETEEEPTLSACGSLLLLAACTVAVAACSEYLVDSIEGVSIDYGVPKAFIGLILLPIVGNAAEHITAVHAAARGKMDLALSIAVGSSTQVAVFIVPFAVLVGWIMDKEMSLDFNVFQAAVFVLAVFLTSSVLQDGATHWLEGAILVAIYIHIAIICWFIPDDPGDGF